MVENLHNGGFPNRASLKVLHSILASEGNRFYFGDRIVVDRGTLVFLHIRATSKVYHIADKDLDRNVTSVTFVDPLLNFLKTAALRDVEHEEAGRAAIHVLVNVFVVSLSTWHVEVNYFVLVGVVDVVRCLDMQLCRFLVLDHSA